MLFQNAKMYRYSMWDLINKYFSKLYVKWFELQTYLRKPLSESKDVFDFLNAKKEEAKQGRSIKLLHFIYIASTN